MKSFTVAFLLTVAIGAVHSYLTPTPSIKHSALMPDLALKSTGVCSVLLKRGGMC
jgi:hypothetical protein